MIVLFSIKWGIIFLGIGLVGSFFIKDQSRLAIGLDVLAVGAGRMLSRERLIGILALGTGVFLAFILRFFTELLDMGLYGEILSLFVYLLFTIQVALSYDQRPMNKGNEELIIKSSPIPSPSIFSGSDYEQYKQEREKLKHMSIEEVLKHRKENQAGDSDRYIALKGEEEFDYEREQERLEEERQNDRRREEEEELERQREEEEWRWQKEEANRLFREQQEEYDRERFC